MSKQSHLNDLTSILTKRTYSRLVGSMHSNFSAGEFVNCDTLKDKLDTVFHDALGAWFHSLSDLRKHTICAVLSSPNIPKNENPTLVKNLCLTNEKTLIDLRFKCSPGKMYEFLNCLGDERLMYFQYDCLDAWLHNNTKSASFFAFGAGSVLNSLPWDIKDVPSWLAKFSTD